MLIFGFISSDVINNQYWQLLSNYILSEQTYSRKLKCWQIRLEQKLEEHKQKWKTIVFLSACSMFCSFIYELTSFSVVCTHYFFSKYQKLTVSIFMFTLVVKKDEEDFEEKKSIKKRIKELKVLDPKIAQNLCK